MRKFRIRIVSGLVVLALLLLVLTRINLGPATTVILGTRHWDVESNSQGAYNSRRIKRYFVRDRSRLRNYHLEVKWVLFESGKAGPFGVE